MKINKNLAIKRHYFKLIQIRKIKVGIDGIKHKKTMFKIIVF